MRRWFHWIFLGIGIVLLILGATLAFYYYYRLPMEIKSGEFTHTAIDVVQSSGKSPGIVTWKIGSNTYTIDNSGDGGGASTKDTDTKK
ncbi:MAG: hypothetical protein WC080_02715 [Patescibacteria group bacterium]